MTKPHLSVVILVYNGAKYLREAIDSVLNQTFQNFELIIINDGSQDESLNIINSYKDSRIRTISNTSNKGIPYCRNMGLNAAKGEFLAWTDCDDINRLDRFEKQLNFLQNNPDFGGCGTWLCRFKGSKTYYITKAIEDHREIKAALLFQPAAVPNPTVMLRLSEIKKANLQYNVEYAISEDYDFIFRCSQHFKFSNLQEVLYKYRASETSIMKQFEKQEKKSYRIIKAIYRKVLSTLGIQLTEAKSQRHYLTCSSIIFEDFLAYKKSYDWLKRIKLVNKTEKTYDEKALNKVLANQFFFTSKKASKFGLKTLNFFIQKSLKSNWGLNPVKIAKLSVRCALRYDKFEFKTKDIHFFK